MENKKKHRKGDDIDMMGQRELLHKIKTLTTKNTKRDRALISFMYLLGGRISEVLPIKRYQIEERIVQDSRFLVIFHVKTLKRKKKVPRNIPINYEKYKDFVDIILDYIIGLEEQDQLFTFTRQRAWQIINERMGLFCHYFRHLRSSHLVEYEGYTEGDLKRFHGWSTDNMANTYVHLDWQYLAKKQI